jgi:hypothetical protein
MFIIVIIIWYHSPLYGLALLRSLLLPTITSLDFLTVGFVWGGAVTPTPNLQPRGPGLRIYNPGDRVTQLYPQALGNHFSRL